MTEVERDNLISAERHALRDSARELAMQALGDAIEKPHGGRLAEALEAIARFIDADRECDKPL